MKRRKPTTVPHEPIPPRVYAIMQRRAREVVSAIGKLPETTLMEFAMCGYYAGLEDMAQALRTHPECVLEVKPPEDWRLP
jgi:hypothetical protein